MKRSSVRLGFAAALVGLLAACGGNDGGTAKTDSSQQKAGSGGTKEQGVACGAKSCTVPDGATGDACCIDQFAGTCGVKSGGATCHPPVMTDERCPVPDLKLNIPAMGIMQPLGCCTRDNECGVDFGVGCQSRTVLCMGIGLDQVDKLKVQTCDGKELPRPADCGTRMVTLPGAAGQSGGK